MKRKNIAVCVTGYDWECASRIINGIFLQMPRIEYKSTCFCINVKKACFKYHRIIVCKYY